jgi:hypothetical protein
MSTEVASTRLPREVVRELDQEAAARGISRSVYVAGLIGQRTRLTVFSAEPLPVIRSQGLFLQSALPF